MSEASLFVPRKRDRERRSAANRQARTGPPPTGPPASIAGTTLPRQQVGPPLPTLPVASGSQRPAATNEGGNSKDIKPNPHITEIKLYSTDPASRSRSNIIKFMSAREFDPEQLTKPILMNRKQPGPRELPVHALDDNGKIVGKYMYDEAGKPMLAPNGQPFIEKKDVGQDPDLIGLVPGQKMKKMKKGVEEVHHQDLNIVRMKREEAVPWVLETGRPRPEGQMQTLGHVPEHWVGRMTEASSLPTVLLINDGRLESGFEVVPLGRTYRFTPERPFKTLDPDAANKLYEHQMKHKVHDRWSQRPDGPALMGNLGGPSSVKTERDDMANRWEARMRGTQPTRVKVEKYEDDFKREGRQQERGMEGGIDEELDYDVAEDFQDDDENNTFYHDQDEEEETKLQEEQIKKEQRLANATVGDRPHIDDPDDEDDDLFGEGKLNTEGRRLRKMMRKRGEGEDYDSSDEDSSDSDDTVRDDKSEKSTKDDKEKEKEKEKDKSAPGSAERPSRPPSRGPAQRQTTSPSGSGKRPNHPAMHGKAGTAPPGSGAAFLAQRATGSRGASPKARSRGNSPHGRATSPESRDGRAMSPPSRGGSPSRALSPPVAGSGGGREGSPSGSGPSNSNPNGQRPPGGKRKNATASPQPGSQGGSSNNSPKRKPSPTPSNGSSSEPRSKKKKSSTPDVAPFANQIHQQEVVEWFRAQPTVDVAMAATIKAFKPKLLATAAEFRTANQNLFMRWVGEVTTKDGGKLTLKPEYRR